MRRSCDPVHSSHDPSYRFTSLPADHSYHVKDVPRLDDEVGVSVCYVIHGSIIVELT